jgi:hypothetical protein
MPGQRSTMFVPRPRHRLRLLFGRLEHVAVTLNPIPTLITIGLAVIDLIFFCSLLQRQYATGASWACSSEAVSPLITDHSAGY